MDYLLEHNSSTVLTDARFAVTLLPAAALIGALLFLGGGLLGDVLEGSIKPTLDMTRWRSCSAAC